LRDAAAHAAFRTGCCAARAIRPGTGASHILSPSANEALQMLGVDEHGLDE